MEGSDTHKDTFVTLKAATDSALAKQQPDSDSGASDGERTTETEQREAERAKLKVGKI